MSAGASAYPTWAIRPGATRSNAKGERVLVGARQADGRVDVWAWRMGGWHKRRQPQTPERVLKAYPTESESGLPVPTVSPSPAWVQVEGSRPLTVSLRMAIEAMADRSVEDFRVAIWHLTPEQRESLRLLRLRINAALEDGP